MRDSELSNYLTTTGGEATITEVADNILIAVLRIEEAVGRIEHVLALGLIMRHGTTEQVERARQHLLEQIELQDRHG